MTNDAAAELDIHVGDIYEDCSFHPCLCTSISYEEGQICGISLIDGTAPRSCSLDFCGVRKMSIEEALKVKLNGPDESEVRERFLPDNRWWGKPRHAHNPGLWAESVFFSSLLFIRQRHECETHLGKRILGWFEPTMEVDLRPAGKASFSYRVEGEAGRSALVSVQAVKEGAMLPIQSIEVKFLESGESVLFSGEEVRGCGRA